MRERYDNNGNLIGLHNMVFDEIPDGFVVKTIFTNDKKFVDLSYLGIYKHLTEQYADKDLKGYDLGIEFQNKNWVGTEVFKHLSLDYLNSAIFLRCGINDDRGEDMATYYLVPCAFLCKHSIELALKFCLLSKGKTNFQGHNVVKLWEMLDETQIPSYKELSNFINEIEQIDYSETALRYGIDKKMQFLPSNLYFDIDCLLSNTMFFFNIVDEYIYSAKH